MTAPKIDVDYTVLDCPDTEALATFYAKVLGWDLARNDGGWAVLQGPGELRLAFQKAPDFTPLDWPSDGIKIHLDLVVDDMEASEKYVLGLGATKLEGNENHPGFAVFRDPVGHIFCLCRRD
ncbi:VOC family protein [Rhodococcus sp. BP-252]|uniref:Glyoxalase n=1 Tax=Rhodococcoides kyotonense TaxID=398843 RepID=A0A177YBJ9_9NOCA|nr:MULTISPECIES: VOC family protein [Rhodococcus]MBY6411698.1 VOC family protein [Rhodococcus sp. BP-320]MBY6417317.1 VOC family protein [Rhodococcus sp. BP-321]MBY6421898.1 VOC family protein [Rhodococcus sp. BP-324]MBY6427341.1 VOC family protein [Rhodococcus sp. BP-323]MBY6432516.1 VOC family protein [Rhodococcus sp. BP-322]